jgi:hypothetical protein
MLGCGMHLKINLMDESNKRKAVVENAAEFVDHQRLLDNAKNERIKEETRTSKLHPDTANNPAKRTRKADTSQKKTGGGKQISPGD